MRFKTTDAASSATARNAFWTEHLWVIVSTLLLAVTTILVVRAAEGGTGQQPASFTTETGAFDAAAVPHGWGPMIESAAQEAEIPAPVLAAQIEAESGWRADAVSPAGAQGPAQFMPETWEAYGRGGDPHDPEQAIAAQGRYMGDLKDQVEGSDVEGDSVDLALASYNAGFGTVDRFDGVPPYPETENYVATIREQTAVYEQPA